MSLRDLQNESFMLGIKLGLMTGRGQDPLNRFDIKSKRILHKDIALMHILIAEAKRDGFKEPSKEALARERSEWLMAALA